VGEEAKMICRDAPVERLLRIPQSFARQGLWNIINNIIVEKYGNFSLRVRETITSQNSQPDLGQIGLI
jgi:hypothetical protein